MEKLEGNDRSLYGAQHSQDLFTSEAIKFINQKKDSSFFLYLPFIIPHLAIQTTQKFLDMYKNKIEEADYNHRGYIQHPFPRAGYAGMITQMDDGIGQIMNEIKKLGLDENTIIIFTSDNGPTYNRLGGSDSDFFNSSGELRGRKGSLYEGGIRVPMVARWPGKIESGTEYNETFALWDIMPTFCEIAGRKIPGYTDGISFLPAITGKDNQKVHKSLYWEFPAYGGQATMIKDNIKLLITNLNEKEGSPVIQLFDLENDIGETNDLSKNHPEVVSEIIHEMKKSHIHSDLFKFPKLETFYKNFNNY